MRFATVWPIVLAAVLIPFAAPMGAAARSPVAYLDDRSTPSALIQSLYNALNRREYARAWSYFSAPPADSLDAYADGYADTQSVTLVAGVPAEEGAAGSMLFTLPVALAATAADGVETVFAGCYRLRLANPQVQGDPYQPLHIEGATMAPTDQALEAALPEQCGDGPALPPQDLVQEHARTRFAASRAADCTDGIAEAAAPETHQIEFHYATDAADQRVRTARLFRFFCSRGAYNETHAFYLADDYGELRALHFATPELDIRYEDDSNEKVRSITMMGVNAAAGLVNSAYDPATLTLTSHAKWRGIGDASSIGTWIFRNGDFTLIKYEVDASYDGEIEHETVVDYDLAP